MLRVTLVAFSLFTAGTSFAGDVISCKNKMKTNKVMCVVNLDDASKRSAVVVKNEYGHGVTRGEVVARRGLRWLVALEPSKYPVRQGYQVELVKAAIK